MFILRRICKDGSQVNTCLGEFYVLEIKETNPKPFSETTKEWDVECVESMYGVVTYEDGSKIMPLYKGSNYYIMASDGRTFDNISEK